jgi:serine/threonine protein phosphatase 1
VIGDIHGRLDLLTDLLRQIQAHNAARPVKETTVVLLGDLIDRGPDSRGVVELARAGVSDGLRLVCLGGNHEELLVAGLTENASALQTWLNVGGYACARSYGVDPGRLFGRSSTEIAAHIEQAIPATHLMFLSSLANYARFGGYILAHAGIRPGIAIDRQSKADLRWIRKPFLESRADHGGMVIHGHSEHPGVDEQPNRIGIDTGAYRTGILTAIWLEDDQRGYLQTSGEPDFSR